MSVFDPSPSKLGVVWKQGSGKGFFANTKWKEKLLCAGLGRCLAHTRSTLVITILTHTL